MSLDQVIRSLNRSLAGWANYFRHGVSKDVFSTIDQFTWGRLMRWTRAKHAGRTGQIQPVEAFDSTSSVNNSEGFFQL
jgi:hypothetical protein